MKRLLLLFCALCVALNVAAQSENSIVIDSKSFRPVQTDVLTGVSIDPIGLIARVVRVQESRCA